MVTNYGKSFEYGPPYVAYGTNVYALGRYGILYRRRKRRKIMDVHHGVIFKPKPAVPMQQIVARNKLRGIWGKPLYDSLYMTTLVGLSGDREIDVDHYEDKLMGRKRDKRNTRRLAEHVFRQFGLEIVWPA